MNIQIGNRVAVVIVTYKRQRLLQELLNSLAQMSEYIWEIIIVDNENSAKTEALINVFKTKANIRVKYMPQTVNLGGSGGFRIGIAEGYKDQADWLWIMDDDVKVLPGSLAKLLELSKKNKAIMGNRLDYNGNVILSPYVLSEYFGIANPFRRNPFKKRNIVKSNMFCFEGGFISTSIIEKTGIPDPRFFIYWDDITYGYLISKYENIARVNVNVVQRTRDTNSLRKGDFVIDTITSEKEYYMIRNRGYLAKYMQKYGDYHSFAFYLGTFYCVFREIIRIILTKQSFNNIASIFKGFKEGNLIIKNKSWMPLNKIEESK